MVKLEYCEALGRKLRKDKPVEELGINTYSKIKEAVKAGRDEEAFELIDYLYPEGKGLHDVYCDWTYADLTYIADKFGEEEVERMLRFARSAVISKVFYGSILDLSLEELVMWFAEQMRAHRSGPQEKGDIIVREEDNRYVMEFDPCGSGGRLRRGSEIDKTPPRTGPPFNLGKTKKRYAWSWSKEGVPYYCIHCCLWHEVMPIEFRGYPIKITEFPSDPNEKCKWYFYKEPELIPDEYFTRVGFKKDISKFKKR